MDNEGNTEAEWSVDLNEAETGVVMSFHHLEDDGIEAFTTAMLREDAIVFATAILNNALEIHTHD